MTYLKSTLILTAAAFSMAATPAFADHHDESMMIKTMTKAEMAVKCKSMMDLDKPAKAAMKAAKPEMAAKCKTMSKAGELTDVVLDGDAMMKSDHKMHDGTTMKTSGGVTELGDGVDYRIPKARIGAPDAHDGMDHGNMKHHDMMKTDAKVHSNMSLEHQNMMRAKIMNDMSATERASFAAMAPEQRNIFMSAKMKTMHVGHATGGMHPSKVNDTVGEVIQADGEPSIQSDRELLMSDGDQMTKEQLIVRDSDHNAMNNSIVVPTVGSNVVTTVSCPVGTTAQSNGTCLVTGNYNYK